MNVIVINFFLFETVKIYKTTIFSGFCFKTPLSVIKKIEITFMCDLSTSA